MVAPLPAPARHTLAFAIFLLLTTAQALAADSGSILAVVNGQPITNTDLKRIVQPVVARMKLRRGSPRHTALLPQIRKKALSILVEQVVIQTSARARQQPVTESALNARITQLIENRHGGDRTKFAAWLTASGRDPASWKAECRAGMLAARIREDLAVTCTPCTAAEARALYQQEPERFKSEVQVRVSLIRLAPDDVDVPNLRQFSTAVRDRVMEDPGGEWETVAKRYSSGPHAGQGGHWNWTHLSDLPDNLGATASTMNIGDVVRVERDGCYYILRLAEERAPEQLSFDEARESVEREVMQRKVDAAWTIWLEAERKKASILIHQP